MRLVKLATLDPLESPALEAPEVKPGRRESQAHQGPLDPPGHEDPLEMTAPRATQDQSVSPETQDPLENLVSVVWMAWEEIKEMTGRPDSLAQLVLLERPVHLDLLGRGDLLDKLVLRADKERKVRRVRLEPRGPLARLDP